MKGLRAALAVAAILVACHRVGAFEAVITSDKLGDRETGVQDAQVPPSRLGERHLPASTFRSREAAGGLTASNPGSLFRLREVPSGLRERTGALLTELKAKEQDGKILIDLPGDVLFDFDRSDIRADARPVLAKLVEVLAAWPDAPVAIEGHTDAKGSDAYNQALSERRAVSVAAWLAAQKVARERLATSGLGESKPVVPNVRPDGSDDPEGRQKNRRVTFVIGQPERR